MSNLPKDFGKIHETPVKFGDKLAGLCAMELAAAHSDPERIGAMIERLINSLAFTIAISVQGDAKAMDTALSGVESHLYEAASTHAKVAQFMAATK